MSEISKQGRTVADVLRNTDDYVSGEKLAASLGVSRTAVWKVIKELRENGFVIDASTWLGYKLLSEKYLDADAIKKYLKHSYIDPQVYRSVSSTNTLAKAAAENGAAEGTLLLADSQSAGRGRVGKSFYSPGGSGLYMSMILRPQMSASDALRITACAAVSTAEAIEEVTGVSTGIKWVNDLFVGNKKVCGILTEASFNMESGGLDYAVLGIGINVFEPERGFGELSNIAGSLFQSTVCSSDIKCRIAAAVMDRFFERYESLSDDLLLREYRERLFILGKKIYVLRHGISLEAVVLDIDSAFRLLVQYANGEREYLSSGEISIIPM